MNFKNGGVFIFEHYPIHLLAAVFGDPHIHTFDGLEYTFNGRGEFVLVRADTLKHKLDVQGRFELVNPNLIKVSKATMLTSVAGNNFFFR